MKLSILFLSVFGFVLASEAALSPQSHWRQYHPKSLPIHGVHKLLAPSSKGPTPSVGPTPSKGPTPSVGPTPSKGPTPSVGPTPSKGPTPSVGPTPSKGPTPSVGPTTSAPVTTAKPTPPHCTPGQKVAVNGTCRNYVECDKSFKWVNKTCSTWCHNFNPATSKCDWSWKYQCSDPVTASPCTNDFTTDPPSTSSAPSRSTTASSATTAASFATTAASSATTSASSATTSATHITTHATSKSTTTTPACSNGTKKVFKKGDCKDYLECDSGKWVKKSCSFGYDFDFNKLTCTWSWWAKC